MTMMMTRIVATMKTKTTMRIANDDDDDEDRG
jgi:hypothetical protein